MAPCSSTPSKPAATAWREAWAKPSIAVAMSASVMASGTGCGCMPATSVYICPGAAIADGPSRRAPAGRLCGWPIRPVCMSWTKMRPPAAWTASVTWRQPATWASLNTPGMRA